MGAASVAVITALSLTLGFLAYSAISSYYYGKKLQGKTTTRGLSGVSGQQLSLQCPSGQVISFANSNKTSSRAVLLAPGAAGTSCDPFFTPGAGQSQYFFNQANTMDMLSGNPFGLASCDGQNSCSFTVPLSSDPRLTSNGCLSGSKSVSLIGTYDCVPS